MKSIFKLIKIQRSNIVFHVTSFSFNSYFYYTKKKEEESAIKQTLKHELCIQFQMYSACEAKLM